MTTNNAFSDAELNALARKVIDRLHKDIGCNCPLHQLSKEERVELIDRAVEQTNEEVIANGGTLPDETQV